MIDIGLALTAIAPGDSISVEDNYLLVKCFFEDCKYCQEMNRYEMPYTAYVPILEPFLI